MQHKTRTIGLIFIIFGLFSLLACGPAQNNEAASDVAQEEEGAIHWEYVGDNGPENWGALNNAFSLCGTGTEQSPIDISGATGTDLANLVFDYGSDSLELVHNGHTVQVNHNSGSSVTIDDETYELVQFHFHAPSEHTINGKSYPVEMHLVHANANGSLAVVGVMIDEGAANDTLSAIWNHLPTEAGDPFTVTEVDVDAINLLPKNRTTFRYNGSLTTPPCSEQVKWNVMTTPITMTADQITAFEEAVVHQNNRPLQPLNDRTVQEDTTTN
ncbi:MAG: carbonic anhydrase family protein [Chloroflexota bacterium]